VDAVSEGVGGGESVDRGNDGEGQDEALCERHDCKERERKGEDWIYREKRGKEERDKEECENATQTQIITFVPSIHHFSHSSTRNAILTTAVRLNVSLFTEVI
jgi:hypothetical protein